MAGEMETVAELKRQNLRLKTALKQHHEWQMNATGLYMFWADPETQEINCCDISKEYPDSTLHDITRRALIMQSDMEPDAAKIRTSHVFPPIPIRTHDWCAWYDGEEEAREYGYGRTEQEAIDDLLENFPAPAPATSQEPQG